MMSEPRPPGLALAPRRHEALMYLATHANASNREIADAISISDQAQASHLGLLVRADGRPGCVDDLATREHRCDRRAGRLGFDTGDLSSACKSAPVDVAPMAAYEAAT
jgi:hypothetical protein